MILGAPFRNIFLFIVAEYLINNVSFDNSKESLIDILYRKFHIFLIF